MSVDTGAGNVSKTRDGPADADFYSQQEAAEFQDFRVDGSGLFLNFLGRGFGLQHQRPWLPDEYRRPLEAEVGAFPRSPATPWG